MSFVSIRTATLRGDQKITFDVHVQVGAKHIVYLRKGDSFEGTRLERLKQKKLKRMYIRPEDETIYLEYLNQNIDRAYDKTAGASMESRAEVIQGAQQSSVEALMEVPEVQANYMAAKDGAARYVEFLMREDSAAKAVLNIENSDRDLAHHGVTVSTLSIAIGQKIGLTDPIKTQLLALGALLHDFGHLNSKLALFLPISGMEKSVREEYVKHSTTGVDVAERHSHFDNLVLNIIRQHEELSDGTGYPGKLVEKNTDPLAVIVSTGNDFDRLMLNEKLTRAETLKKFVVSRVGLHPLEQIQALKTII